MKKPIVLVIMDGVGRGDGAFAEQTVTFGFVGTVVDSFGLQHLTTRILKDFFR